MFEAEQPTERVAAFIAYWESIRPAPDLLPGRQHFDPIDIPHLLPNIWLLDVLPGWPRRFQVRLVGGAVIEAGFIGRPGDFMDDPRISPDPKQVVAVLDRIVEIRRPDWRRGAAIVDHTKFVHSIERAMLPLARDGRTVDMILSMTVFHWQDGRMT